MTCPSVNVDWIGQERHPIAIVDDFHPDPDRLREAALDTPFAAARHHYPGVRAPLPATYFASVQSRLAGVLRDTFALATEFDVIDTSFSIVTTPPADLALEQRLPHVDATDEGRIALVHYLSRDDGDGTAFFRHRATGFESIDRLRAGIFYPHLDAELRAGALPPQAYVRDDTPLFERTHLVDARYNRAVIYRSSLLHSGAIAPAAALTPDPATGRLTITAFLDTARAGTGRHD